MFRERTDSQRWTWVCLYVVCERPRASRQTGEDSIMAHIHSLVHLFGPLFSWGSRKEEKEVSSILLQPCLSLLGLPLPPLPLANYHFLKFWRKEKREEKKLKCFHFSIKLDGAMREGTQLMKRDMVLNCSFQNPSSWDLCMEHVIWS